MNLIDAIKSGRPFRRPEFPPGKWYSYPSRVVIMCRSDGPQYSPDKEDILADDWEILEPTVTLTRTQFWEAYSNVMNDWQANHAYPVGAYAPVEVIVPALARKLGLE